MSKTITSLVDEEHDTVAERYLQLNNRMHQNFWLGTQELLGFFANSDINYEKYYPGQHGKEGNRQSNGPDNRNRTVSSSSGNNALSKSYLFDPQGKRILIWDVVCVVFIIFTVFYVPVQVSFLAYAPLSRPLEIVDYVIDAVFFADVCVTSNTAYYSSEMDTYIIDRMSIVTRYAKFWLWIDLAAAMPFAAITDAAVTNNNPGQIKKLFDEYLLSLPSMHTINMPSKSAGQIRVVRLIRILRLVRLAKLYKLAKFGWVKDTLDKYNISPAFVGLCVLVSQVTDPILLPNLIRA